MKRELDLIDVIKDFIACGKPFMGICLGFQLLFTESEEFGLNKGLGVIEGNVESLSRKLTSVPVPHVGWNNLLSIMEDDLFNNLDSDSHFYFDHSYKFVTNDEKTILGYC